METGLVDRGAIFDLHGTRGSAKAGKADVDCVAMCRPWVSFRGSDAGVICMRYNGCRIDRGQRNRQLAGAGRGLAARFALSFPTTT